ncbi:hypothetical protein IT568_12800, partial [bacterium]|nr:hypothetical protein [bacterium]
SLLLTYPLENFDVFTSFTSDFLEYKGTFYNTSGVAFEKELSEQTICDLTAKINFANSKFNETNIGVSKAAFNFTGIETGLNYNFSENLYLRLHFEFDYFFDSELRNALPEKYPKNFGLTLGGNF